MEFADFETTYDTFRRTGAIDKSLTSWDFYTGFITRRGTDQNVAGQMQVERNWVASKRPYYSLYPGVAESLAKVRMDVPAERLTLPKQELLIRLPQGGWHGIRCVLAAHITVLTGEKGLGVWVDQGERAAYASPIYLYRKFPLSPGKTVEELASGVAEDQPLDQEERERTNAAIRIVLACALLDQGDPLVQPDVLSKDKPRLSAENVERLAAKAQRRGKIGWIIGSGEVSPHHRRSHFATRWTGPGRKVPKIVSVKATWVHRQKVEDVPTGELG